MSIGQNMLPTQFVYAKLLTGFSAGPIMPEENITSEQITPTSNGAYCTYTFRNNTPTPTKSGVSQLDSVTLIVNIFVDVNTEYNRLKTYIGSVRDALDGYRESDPLAQTDSVQSVSFENVETGYDDDFEPEGLYYAQMTFNIRIAKQ